VTIYHISSSGDSLGVLEEHWISMLGFFGESFKGNIWNEVIWDHLNPPKGNLQKTMRKHFAVMFVGLSKKCNRDPVSLNRKLNLHHS
jgi:hypothetical protein